MRRSTAEVGDAQGRPDARRSTAGRALRDDLIDSIKGLYSVAVEALPGELPRAHGPWRLARYAQYLLREVLPLHDDLCAEEGRLMLAHLAGDPSAVESLRPLQGRADALYDHLWGSR